MTRIVSLSLLACMLVVGCGSGEGGGNAAQESVVDILKIPSGFPAPRTPEDNAPSVAKRELGRRLFYDERLSANRQQSCASCHQQNLAFTDGLPHAVGSTGQAHSRSSLSLTNVGYNATLNWASPNLTALEQQILVPLFNESPIELGATSGSDEILARIADDAAYRARFEEAFAGEAELVSWDHVVKALATFVRALVAFDSAFDRFVYKNQVAALDDSERRGMELFFSERLECHHCHGGFNFTESSVHASSGFEAERFHNTGLYNLDGEGAYPTDNQGTYELTGDPKDMGHFRAPTLRNIAVTAPYMHDGSVETLEDVVRIYEAGGRNVTEGPYAGDGRENPLKSGFVAGFSLTDQERSDLVRFLEALTDTNFLSDPQLSNPFPADP